MLEGMDEFFEKYGDLFKYDPVEFARWEGEELGYDRGVEQGIEQNRTEMISNMIKNDIPDKLIIKSANISKKELDDIKKSINYDMSN